MAQLTEALVQDILNGAGCTRNEIEQLCHAWLLATPQSSAPVVGDELASLYDAASVGFHISESCGPERKFLRITSFPSLDALQAYEDAWTEAMVSVRDARRESALTGRG